MKKNIMMRLASILLIAVLMSTCAISGTFAKYSTVTSGKASARVAKWSFDVGETDITTQAFTFDLGMTITEIGGGEESDVATENDKLLLAPGTQGSFDIVLENTSEVTAQYKVVFNKSNMPTNFTYTYTYTYTDGDEITVDKVNTNEEALAQFAQIGMNDKVTITVNWEWPFGGDINYEENETSSDKQYQSQEDKSLELGVTVTVEQVN